MPETITPPELAQKCQSCEVELIDVRTPAEFEECHVVAARCVPLDRLDPKALMSARSDPQAPLYVICRTGTRAKMARDRFRAAGFDNIVCVEGGTLAWDAAGLPVKRGRNAMSLERQVRIAAGSLVLLGVALGFLVHEALFGLSAFIGAGLVFAGLTDTCGMGMLLARMPWNRRGAACA